MAPTDVDDAVGRLTALWADSVPTVVVGDGALPPGDGDSGAGAVVISTERLTRVVDLDRESSALIAQAGATVGSVREAASSIGLWCPPLRWLPAATSIGAALAGAHGRRSRAHGTVADHVLGTGFVCPAVGLARHGGKAIKNASGFHLSAALAGSRGELGVILDVTLRLVPVPGHRAARCFRFPSAELAFERVRGLAETSLEAAAVELSVRPDSNSAWILVEVEDSFLGNVERRLDRLTDRAIQLGGQIDDSAAWPAAPPGGAAARRASVDPKRFSAIGHQLIAVCQEHLISGSIVAEATGGAVEARLAAHSAEGMAAIARLFPSPADRADSNVLHHLLKSAFDPNGLLRQRSN
ncbi:MAG: FAD-binding oxidoreductase [Chloroflexota bacterium]